MGASGAPGDRPNGLKAEEERRNSDPDSEERQELIQTSSAGGESSYHSTHPLNHSGKGRRDSSHHNAFHLLSYIIICTGGSTPPEVPEHTIDQINEYSSQDNNESAADVHNVLLHTVIGNPGMINNLTYDVIHESTYFRKILSMI